MNVTNVIRFTGYIHQTGLDRLATDTREGSHKSPEMTWLKLPTKLTEH